MSAGWTVLVRAPAGDLQLEHLADAADEWYAEGPGGSAIGELEAVLTAAARPAADADWRAVVMATIRRDLRTGEQRVGLVARRGEGEWLHASRSVNRESIARHGLDWRRMATAGIAGSIWPEHPGIFLCATLEDAHWFAAMAREPADIWSVDVNGVWLVSDPGASGGLGDDWMIALEPLPPTAVRLLVP